MCGTSQVLCNSNELKKYTLKVSAPNDECIFHWLAGLDGMLPIGHPWPFLEPPLGFIIELLHDALYGN